MNRPTKSTATRPATKRAAAKRAAATWKSPGSADELAPADQLAHLILTERPDLLPSLERIMTADLGADGRHQALTLFQDALTTPGDPNRDPRVAIQRCSAQGGTS